MTGALGSEGVWIVFIATHFDSCVRDEESDGIKARKRWWRKSREKRAEAESTDAEPTRGAVIDFCGTSCTE